MLLFKLQAVFLKLLSYFNILFFILSLQTLVGTHCTPQLWICHIASAHSHTYSWLMVTVLGSAAQKHASLLLTTRLWPQSFFPSHLLFIIPLFI